MLKENVSIRGARILVFGACTHAGSRLSEAFLALGAHVYAADPLRTRLEELRAQLRQHERLWVAESEPSVPGAALALFADVARDESIDAALMIVPPVEADDLFEPDQAWLLAQLMALPRCACFLHAALQVMGGKHAHGRALVLIEPGGAAMAGVLEGALNPLVTSAGVRGQALGMSVCGLCLPNSPAAMLDRVLSLVDSDRSAATGWLSEA